MHEAAYCDVYPAAKRAAQVYAAAAVVARALPSADRADFEQEALLALWRALPKFDPTRASLRTFSERVIANQIASTARAQRAVRRTPVLTEAPACSEHPGFTIELRLDVERALALLHADDRRLARLLADYSPTEASRMLRTSRSTIYEGIHRIRVAFLGAGLVLGSASTMIPKAHLEDSGGRVPTECCGPESGDRDKSARIVAQPKADDGAFMEPYDSGRVHLDQIVAYQSCGGAADTDAERGAA